MVKIPCQVCNIEGTLQKVGNNYYRIRHYGGSFNKKLKFHYHQIDKPYALKHLEKLKQQNMLFHYSQIAFCLRKKQPVNTFKKAVLDKTLF